jgi:ElaB/YqjD/DUF883 family membrane-anchored ribosome-binding protein
MPKQVSTYEEPIADQVAEAARGAKESISDAAMNAKEKAEQLGRSAAKKIDESRGPAASSLESAAAALRDKAQTLPGGEKIADVAHSAADKLEATADYVKRHDTKQMAADVESMVRRHPGRSLMIAAAIGFLFGRAFQKD